MLRVCCGVFCREPWTLCVCDELQRAKDRGAEVLCVLLWSLHLCRVLWLFLHFCRKQRDSWRARGCCRAVSALSRRRNSAGTCIIGVRKKYNLVPQCLIGSIAPPISFKLLILCNRIPVKISTTTLNVRALFYFGLRFLTCAI